MQVQGPLRVSLAVVYETGQRTGAQQCLRVPEVPEKRSMNRLEIWRIFVSNAKPCACRLKKVQSQSLTRMRISFPYNTFLRRRGRFSTKPTSECSCHDAPVFGHGKAEGGGMKCIRSQSKVFEGIGRKEKGVWKHFPLDRS